MKRIFNLLLNIGTLILLWFVIEKNYMPQFFSIILIAFGIYRYYSIMKSIKINSAFENGLRVKKINLNFYFYFIIFLLIRELFLNSFTNLYLVIIIVLFGIIIILESYLEMKYQKILLKIEENRLLYFKNETTVRDIYELKAITFHSVGNYFVLIFDNKSSITIKRNSFVASELNDFMNKLISLCSANVNVSIDAKEKIGLA
ncbi:hypothetical protein OX283_003740 [Flavobacterium sp. SUN052]|uniref:hypothetical protein n=1 Tax=Flavobacterium sp. SUN052 TaxID=3002441 RepID=UPI00237E85CD|nr:hypothetical protein [Flavobacterium sp. SUN052]MEC4003756.1 hypothetical protein [Flavobacterium sp. SUN052]